MLGYSRLGTISNRRLTAPTLSELRLGLEVNEGGNTRGSGIRVDRGFKPILKETSIPPDWTKRSFLEILSSCSHLHENAFNQ